MVQPQPLPQSQREERTGRGHRAHHNSGLQLVQEQEAEGQGLRRIGVIMENSGHLHSINNL